ncbi:MAG: 50S ribosomal protein L3 [Candidatus Aenigmarchaeota archaeon]|nr:50S ribosomal protein L3 [Candidatus Aenigmarchaeota archaeon]
MPHIRRPLRGSRAFWPKKRAKRIYPKIQRWPVVQAAIPLGFSGYKAGMTHVMLVDTNTNSKTKGQLISRPVTVLECPPLFVYGIRGYSASNSTDVFFDKPSKNLSRKIKLPKTPKMSLEKIDGKKFDRINLVCNTQPVFKKTPEVFEVALGGTPEEQLNFAKNNLGKEIKLSDVFKEGDFVDAIAVTRGKGFQGTVKRFGTRIQGRKNEQAHRKIGNHGQDNPGKIRNSVPQAGQLGFQTRTEFNKKILKISSGSDINPKSGFVNYGLINGDYVLIEGSVPGPRKRLIRLRTALRPFKTKYPVDIKYISIESKQGD